jgi:hypothetical protein
VKVPQPRSRGILSDEMSVASQFGFGGAQLVGRGAVAGALRDMVVVACDGEGLVCDGFVVSLRDVSGCFGRCIYCGEGIRWPAHSCCKF